MSVMDRVHRSARQQYVTAKVRSAVDQARDMLAVGGEPEVALELLVQAVDVARSWDYDETPAVFSELLYVYEHSDARSMALVNAVNWNVPAELVLRAAGVERRL